MFLSTGNCPHCQCTTLRRTRRRLIDLPLRLLAYTAVRCDNCMARFYVRRSAESSSPASVEQAADRRQRTFVVK